MIFIYISIYFFIAYNYCVDLHVPFLRFIFVVLFKCLLCDLCSMFDGMCLLCFMACVVLYFFLLICRDGTEVNNNSLL